MSCKLPCGAASEQRKRLLIGPVWPAAVRRGLSWPFHGSPLGGARGRRPVMRRPPHLAGERPVGRGGGHSWAIRGEIMRSFSPPSSPLRCASTTVLLRGVGAYHRTFYFIYFFIIFFISPVPPAEGAVIPPHHPRSFKCTGGHLTSTPTAPLNSPVRRGSIAQQGAAQRRLGGSGANWPSCRHRVAQHQLRASELSCCQCQPRPLSVQNDRRR